MRILLHGALAVAFAIAGPAAAQTLLTGNKGENTLGFVDLKSGKEVTRVATGPAPHEIAISPDGKQAAVVNYGGREVQLFDVATAKLVRAIDLGEGTRPHGLVWLADGRMLASAEGVNAIKLIARDGTVTTLPTGVKGSHMVAVDAPRNRAWVGNMAAETVSGFDLASGKRTDFTVGGTPEGLAVSNDGKTLWVGDLRGASLGVFDTASGKELARFPTGNMPIRVAMTPDGKQAVVSHAGDGTLGVYDVATRRATRTIPVGGKEAGQVTILFSADGKRIYAAETARDMVAEVDFASGQVLRRLPAGKNGDGLAISPVTMKAK